MNEYKIKYDLGSSFLTYIYEDTDDHTKLAFSVYNDFKLAKRIVELLNEDERKNQ